MTREPAFFINKNKYKEIEVNASVGVAGIYTGMAVKPGVGVVRRFEMPCPNLITNLGMDALGSVPGFSRMHLGTGTSAPAFTDTGLENFGVAVSGSNPVTDQGGSGASPHYGYTRMTWTSEVGGATGVWTEIGVGRTTSPGGLRSRALILDSVGNPTSFPVLADEQFVGTYELRFYAPSADAPATVTLGSQTYETVTRALRVTNSSSWAPSVTGTSSDGAFQVLTGSFGSNTAFYTGGMGAVTDHNPNGSILSGGSSSRRSYGYTDGSHYRDFGVRIGAGAANGLIRTVRWLTISAAFQIEYNPVIEKLDDEELIVNQRISWARQ